MVNALRSLWSDEEGQGLPEYALLVAAVVVMVVAAAALFGEQVEGLFTSIGGFINEKNPINSPPAAGN